MTKQKTLGDGFEPDAARYRKCSEPRSPADCTKALNDFSRELGELRAKYLIKDLLSIHCVAVIEEDGEVSEMHSTLGYGSPLAWESMAACLYGCEKAKHEERIRKMLKGTP